MKAQLKQVGAFIWEMVKVVAIALVIILPIRYFLVQPFYVKGSSMEPNYHDYEYLIIDEITYRFNEPHRGDVVVLRDPSSSGQYFIKRIIGLPGETITITNGKVAIDGVDLDESVYLSDTLETYTSNVATTDLTDNQYFVLGDNRPVSHDSRRFGPVDQSEFVGRVWVRAWPFNRFSVYATQPALY
jgi:signal peptidase I